MSLQLEIVSDGGWDEIKEEFTDPVHCTIVMEHSLVSIQKWESKWHKSFLAAKEFTRAESVSYWQCMTLTQHVDPKIYAFITPLQAKQINDYIADPMTATVVKEDENKRKNREIQTAETLYNMMIELEIPFECRKWHFNQLMTLIRVRAAKSQGGKKMSKKDIYEQNKALNAARRAKHGTRG